MKKYAWTKAVVLLLSVICFPGGNTLAMKHEWQQVVAGGLSLSVPKEWQVKIAPVNGAEFFGDGEMIGHIGYGKHDPDIPLEYHLGNHVQNYKVTKLSGYNFPEVYRYDVDRGEPAAANSNKITKQVYIFFIDKAHNTGIALVFFKSSVDDNTIMKISKTVKLKST